MSPGGRAERSGERPALLGLPLRAPVLQVGKKKKKNDPTLEITQEGKSWPSWRAHMPRTLVLEAFRIEPFGVSVGSNLGVTTAVMCCTAFTAFLGRVQHATEEG